MAPNLLATAGVVLYVSLAVLWDVRERRIPNWLSAAGLVLALGAALVDGGIGLWPALAGAGLGGGILVVPFVLGAVGGGDVKFAAVSGAWLGPRLGFNALLLGTAFGLFAALGAAAATGRAGTAVSSAARLVWILAATVSIVHLPPQNPTAGRLAPIPYAVPLAAGVVGAVLLAQRGWLLV